ncbi:MAG: sugar nucleotide-binding protein [Atribacterota bacterium]|nr:sugar nucleotide-binding protein [Atribacterota bacterium]
MNSYFHRLVFDGWQEGDAVAYSEDYKTNPINIYGKSKLAGEEEIKKIVDEYFIIRTAWLYGLKGNNFVYTMLRLSKERDVVKVVEDQWGSPTYTADLAGVILKIIEDDSVGYGTYHFTNEGMTSWYDFTRTIYKKAKRLGLFERNKNVEIQPIETEDYPTAARRPRYSVLSKKKIKKEFNIKIREWDEALEDFLVSLKKDREGIESRLKKW